VVGAGWAGCAAAVELTLRGHPVHLLESSRILGGRARNFRSSTQEGADVWEARLDNGQHILLGAYTQSLKLMRKIGVDLEQSFLRLPLQMRYPANTDGMDFVASRLLAPLHLLSALLRARGLNGVDKLALARFTTTARWMGWTLHQDCSVAELLERFDQTPRLISLLWRPLCLAALNTAPTAASAQIFLNVLRDSLGACRTASDMLIPRIGLSELFPGPAAAFVQSNGGRVSTGARAMALSPVGAGWHLMGPELDQSQYYDAVILATPIIETMRLLSDPSPTLLYEPIITCYLQYDPALRLPQPFNALLDDSSKHHWGQFVFDRGHLDSNQAGLLAVVISAASEAAALPQKELSDAVALQLATAFNNDVLAAPCRVKVVTEKRATFSCAPGLIRPGVETGLANVWRAGDYVASDYPATIEAAVRSGIAAAERIDAPS